MSHEGRIAALEAQLAELAKPVDSLTPTYQTVNPDGTVGANFTGHVHAQGLDLDAGNSGTPPSEDRIRWLRQSDGAVIADQTSYDFGSNKTLKIRSYEPDGGDASTIDLGAADNTGHVQAELTIQQASGNPGGVIFLNSGTHNLTLLDIGGVSDLLQLASTRRLALDLGVANLTWAASTTASTVVAHGLTRAPQAVLALQQGTPGTLELRLGADTTTTTDFTLHGTLSAAATQTLSMFWVALG